LPCGSAMNVQKDVMFQADSWMQGVQNYRAQKSAPVIPVEPLKIVKRNEREVMPYNPITQVFKDPKMEQARRQEEKDALVPTLNKAYDKQLSKESHFNVINQQARHGHAYEKPYVPQIKPPSLVTATKLKYDLFSNLPLTEQHWAPPDRRPPPPSPPKPPRQMEYARPRDFDIISNKFKHRHADKTLADLDQKKTAIVDKYWETRDFDVIRCAYVDTEKEAYYQQRIGEMIEQQGAEAIAKMPLSLQRSESMLYDITTGVVKDQERLNQLEARRLQDLAARAARVSFEESIRARDQAVQSKTNEQAYKRISHDRFTESTSRGFNILTTESYAKSGRMPPLPKTSAKPTLYQLAKDPALPSSSVYRPPSTQADTAPVVRSRAGSAGEAGSRAGSVGSMGSRQSGGLSSRPVRSGGFNRRPSRDE